MKPDHSPGTESTPGEGKFPGYRWRFITLIDGLSIMVANAPKEMDLVRQSIQKLLMAAYHLLDVRSGGTPQRGNPFAMKSAIKELNNAFDPFGLGVESSDKLHAWRIRDLKEGRMLIFLTV